MRDGRIPLPNQHRRKSNQHYVMFLMESPLNDGFHYEKFKNFFNWTMTFRRDSDFYRYIKRNKFCFITLLDNAPNYLVGCVIQKRC